jgi:hypothetical protein
MIHRPALFVSSLFALTLWNSPLPAAEPNTLTPEEIADGWILLFDGHTDYGWKAGSPVNWQVADGVISATAGEKGVLYTTSPFADYVLKVDFRAPKETNSGIFLRTPAVPTDAAVDSYELNIAEPALSPFPTGSFVNRQKGTGQGKPGEWQTFTVKAVGGHFQVDLDGQPVLDYQDPKPLGRGFIGLQFNQGKIEFRNVKLKPLGLESIFNGRDLTGWKEFPGKKSVFSVTPAGELNVKNGNGQLESQREFADFVLQLDIYSSGKFLNSGIFFRCIPGEFWQGYESQIQNGTVNNDPLKPFDFGTGGIYRRQPARKVVSRDFEWFTKTLVVAGDRAAVWVNGYQVNDWTDTRPPHENPRNGLRRQGGTLAIQGHDPTTNLSFRELRIVEMPAR